MSFLVGRLCRFRIILPGDCIIVVGYWHMRSKIITRQKYLLICCNASIMPCYSYTFPSLMSCFHCFASVPVVQFIFRLVSFQNLHRNSFIVIVPQGPLKWNRHNSSKRHRKTMTNRGIQNGSPLSRLLQRSVFFFFFMQMKRNNIRGGVVGETTTLEHSMSLVKTY